MTCTSYSPLSALRPEVIWYALLLDFGEFGVEHENGLDNAVDVPCCRRVSPCHRVQSICKLSFISTLGCCGVDSDVPLPVVYDEPVGRYRLQTQQSSTFHHS